MASVATEALPFAEPLAGRFAGPLPASLSLYWLGQAGFALRAGGYRILIDPYLSDSLALKYRGTATPHERMMPAPITPDELGPIDLVLCTHHHTDHLDAATLVPLAARLPALRFAVPAASADLATTRIGVGEDRLIPLDAGMAVEPLPGLRVHAVRAAHETLETDALGRHRFLGYGLDWGGLRLFHSGDTIPFEGQATEVAALRSHLALLPVNGRSPALRAAGIAGNLTLDEAAALCATCGIPAMIAHHHGLFAFNTADPAEIDARAAVAAPLELLRARVQVEYRLRAA